LEDASSAVVSAAAAAVGVDEASATAVVMGVLQGTRTILYHNGDTVYRQDTSRLASQWGHIGLLGVDPAVGLGVGEDVALAEVVVPVGASQWHRSLRNTRRVGQGSGSGRSPVGTRRTRRSLSSCSNQR
jgi:hypothetical protein